MLGCSLMNERSEVDEYVLTLTDTHAFLVGQAPGQTLRMDEFAAIESLPLRVRQGAAIRSLGFEIADHKALVRQYYQQGVLQYTQIAVGSDANERRQLPTESFVGFCQPTGKSEILK